MKFAPKKALSEPFCSEQTDHKRRKRAIFASVAVHSLILTLITPEIYEYWEQRDTILRVLTQNAKSVWNGDSDKITDYKSNLKEQLDNGERPDLGEFYLNTEYLEGLIDENTRDTAENKLNALIVQYNEMAGDNDKNTVINAIIREQGKYDKDHSYLSSILLGEGGNCQARAKLMSVLVQKVYPDIPIQYQFVKIDNTAHTRTLIEIDGGWYRMEEPELIRIYEKEFKATVLAEEDDYIDSYVGKKPNIEYQKLDSGEVIKKLGPINNIITDDYLNLQMPVSYDQIQDVAKPLSIQLVGGTESFAEQNAGIGGKNRFSDAGKNAPNKYPMELEVLTDEETKRRVEQSKKWNEYYNVNTKVPSDMPDKPEILKEINGLENFTWELHLETYMRSIHGKPSGERMFFSSIPNFPLFQNNLKYADVFLQDYTLDVSIYFDALVNSPKLQKEFYQWVRPYFKKIVLAMNSDVRIENMQMLEHISSYLDTYNHESETAYYELLISDSEEDFGAENMFVILTHEDYTRYKNGKFSESELDLYDSGPSSYNRYAEAFIYRRVNNGFNVETLKMWVNQVISDMRPLMREPQVKF